MGTKTVGTQLVTPCNEKIHYHTFILISASLQDGNVLTAPHEP